jgi:hypothetical protein
MVSSGRAIAPLFPLGGPVPGKLIIGRDAEMAELAGQIREGVSTLVIGPRRVGKTTVCAEVCRQLADEHGALVVVVEVPERPDAAELLQLMIDACAAVNVGDAARGLLRVLRPTIEKWLGENGIPLDLSQLGSGERMLAARHIIGLPLRISQEHDRRVLVFFDELQRVADYGEGHTVLTDIRDIYSGAREHAVVLVDGSEERTFAGLLGDPVQFGKLVSRYELPITIPAYLWRQPLTERFAAADLHIADGQRDTIIAFGQGRPYDTMAAARYTAIAARQGSGTVTGFDVQVGLDRARRHLEDDGAT